MLRIGILGTDSSHCEAFAGLANGPGSPLGMDARVTTLWGADAAEAARKAERCGVADVQADVESLLERVDAVMVCSRWSEDRFALAAPALRRGLPTYIDKSLGNSLNEAQELAELATRHRATVLCCSPLRFSPALETILGRLAALGGILAGVVAGPAHWPMGDPRDRNPLWYAVHTAEVFHAIAGPGVRMIAVEPAAGGGRKALVRTDRGASFLVAFLSEMTQPAYTVMAVGRAGDYRGQLLEDAAIYRQALGAFVAAVETGTSPVSIEAALEVMQLMQGIFGKGAGNARLPGEDRSPWV